MDWGAALAQGVASGAGAVQQQWQQDQDEQRWLKKTQQLLAMQGDAELQKARYLQALKGPETKDVKGVDEAGNPVIKHQVYQMPSDADIKAGKTGTWNTTDTAPDINFAKLDETQRNNDLKNQAAQDRIAMQQALGDARNEAYLARIEAANARGERDRADKLESFTDPHGNSYYGVVKGGKVTPVTDQDGNILYNQRWRERGQGSVAGTSETIPLVSGGKLAAKKGDDIGPQYAASEYGDRPSLDDMPQSNSQPRVTVVDPSPMSQFAGPRKQPAQQSQPSQGDHGPVVRTGKTADGRKAIKYADGTVVIQ